MEWYFFVCYWMLCLSEGGMRLFCCLLPLTSPKALRSRPSSGQTENSKVNGSRLLYRGSYFLMLSLIICSREQHDAIKLLTYRRQNLLGLPWNFHSVEGFNTLSHFLTNENKHRWHYNNDTKRKEYGLLYNLWNFVPAKAVPKKIDMASKPPASKVMHE